MVKCSRIIYGRLTMSEANWKCVNDKTNFNSPTATYRSVRLRETNIFSIFIRMHVVYWADIRTYPIFYTSVSVCLSAYRCVCMTLFSSVHERHARSFAFLHKKKRKCKKEKKSKETREKKSFKIDLCENVDAQVLVK